MPKFSPRPEVRIRQIPSDPRLHITVGGYTTSGHISSTNITINAGSFPVVAVEFDTKRLWSESGWSESDTTLIEFQANHVYADDIANLTLGDRPQDLQFAAAMRAVADCFNPGPPPPCEHDTVIDVSTLGSPQATGVCGQCGTSMVADYVQTVGEWKTSA